jgi:hypothetical protein
MAKGGHRHQLIIYQFMLDRWWKVILFTGITLLVLAAGLAGLPVILTQYRFMWVPDWKLWVVSGAGGFAICFSIFMILIRKNAYVQPFENYLRLVTPFLRLNISYNRIRRTYTAEVQQLFPPNQSSKWQREMLRPLAKQTAVVLELAGFPIPRSTLLFFLSPIFFPAKTPLLALLVPEWIKFSTELESRRGSLKDSQREQPDEEPRSRLLSEITKSRK